MRDILTKLAQFYDQFIEQVKKTIQFGIEREMLKLPPERRKYLTEAELQILAKASAFIRTFFSK